MKLKNASTGTVEATPETEAEATDYDQWEYEHAVGRVLKEQYTSTLYHGHGEGPPPGRKKSMPHSELVVPPKARLLGSGSLMRKLFLAFRLVSTALLGLLVLSAIAAAYGLNFAVVTDGSGRLGIGLYGVVVTAHMLIQSVMAWINKRQMENLRTFKRKQLLGWRFKYLPTKKILCIFACVSRVSCY